jgi:putative ABC transport system permease protein
MFAYYLDLALHSLKRNPVLTALMVLAIALGIGASMTTLTVLHVLSGDPLPGRSAHIYYPQIDPADMNGYQPGGEPADQFT